MSAPNLGRLEQVDVRSVWTSEASDFTPWLATEANLALLGEAIGLELELEAQEKFVGPFRADILCKDLANGAWVLIENQLERTDHIHLGQLLTYAAGLQAVTIIWVSPQFRDEHRAALDWLNKITAEGVNFFGLEIELWRIGDSPSAPKFNIVSQPNDWSKTVSAGAQQIETGQSSPMEQLQLEYWTAFREYLEQQHSALKSHKASPQQWMYLAIDGAGFLLMATVGAKNMWIQAALDIQSSNAKAHFHLLAQDKVAIEAELGTQLMWQELPGKKQSRIALRRDGMDPKARDQWPVQHAWLKENLEALQRVFGPRVKNLNANDYQPSTAFDEQSGEIPE